VTAFAGERFEAADLPRELARKTTPHAVLASACEDGRLWVALASERPVGFAFVGVVDGRAHLAEMSVHPTTSAAGSARSCSSMRSTGAARRNDPARR
jgi:hypothetical protein